MRVHVTLQGVVLNNVDRMIAQSIAAPFLSFGLTNELQTEQEVRDALEKRERGLVARFAFRHRVSLRSS